MNHNPPRPLPQLLNLAPYVAGAAKIAGVARPIRLASNEAALGASPAVIAAVSAAADEVFRYPDGASHEIRAALAAHYAIPIERIACGAGSDELIKLVMSCYASAGDEVLLSAHGFIMHRIFATAAGANLVLVPETPDIRADVAGLLAHLTPRTRIVAIANPNNPTGAMLTRAEIATLHAGLPSDCLLILDSAYAEYVAEDADYSAGHDMAAAYENVMVLRTFSKAYGMAGLRLGWVDAAPAIIDILNRARNPFNVGLLAQIAGIAALQDTAYLQRTLEHNREWRQWFADSCIGLGLEVAHADPQYGAGNFVMVGFGTAANANSAQAWLQQHGILVRPAAAHGLPQYLRITIGLGEEMQAVHDVLRRFMEQSRDAL